ncbi:MAG: lysophospholipid acyltransferase family protein [Candidatus Omnitrophota bacterium]
MLNALLSVFFWASCVFLIALLYLVQLILLIFCGSFDKQRRILHRQCFWWSSAVIGLSPYWKLKVNGLGNADPKRTYVIVANHQSLADIVVLYQLRLQFKWVAKESLFSIPFLGWCLGLCKHISLKRKDHGSIRDVFREAIGYLRAGMSVLFFPEGTRSETDTMNSFQNGAFKLAISEKIPILPVVISGTRNAIPKGGWVMRSRVFCNLTVLEPIETAHLQHSDFPRLSEIVRSRMAEKLI